MSSTKLTNITRSRKIVDSLLYQCDIIINGDKPGDIKVHNPQFFKRVLKEGSMGLGESYMDGWWDCEYLDSFFYKLLNKQIDSKVTGNFHDAVYYVVSRIINLQSISRSRKVARVHYNLGNNLFESMLDPWMQYSCAYWKDAYNLEQAQVKKLSLICDKLMLKPGMKVLDVGCGWGGLASFIAKKYNVSVTGITISDEQKKLAEDRCDGLDVVIELTDYRELQGKFDRIVSVGMFEHVGLKNYDIFFKKMHDILTDDGLFLLHCIGSNQSGGGVDPWINRYIFPNGRLPSIQEIVSCTEGRFIMEDWHNFGADYDMTLMAWDKNFLDNWEYNKKDYDERFLRMFHYYLCSCAGAFRAREIQLWQVLFSKNGVRGGLRVAR
ncbi:cyclopropane fatty acyl phospholipid synthase [Citrobacter freundii]|nr:cyclopropane fatty acyl phospholipid synthase [Citrobacter freundii]MBC6506008.1 cyclopropane fatty acyl phospholipid synthase [Citrobacter freundii]